MLRKHYNMSSFRAGRLHERELFKREIHDGLSQELLGLQVLTTSLVQSQANQDNQRLILKIKEQLDRTLCSLNSFVNDTVPNHIENKSIEEAVHSCLQFEDDRTLEVIGNSNIVVELDGIGMELFRVIQEFISNVIKHSSASKVIVWFEPKENGTQILLEENGPGFDVENAELGNGLNNMAYRLESIGASYSYSSSIGNGTSLKIEVEHEID